MKNSSNNLIRGSDYENYLPGRIILSSSHLPLERTSYYIGWHTQPSTLIELSRPATAEHQFVLYGSKEEQGEYKYNNGQWLSYIKRENDWFIAPACENELHWKLNASDSSEESSICRIHLPPEALYQKAMECFGTVRPKVDIKHCMNIQDPFMTELAYEIRRELSSSSSISSLYIEQIMDLFTFHIIKKYCLLNIKPELKSPMLSRIRRERTVEYIHDNLAKDISLDDLADSAYLSKYYFARAFKTTFKTTPAKYVLNERVKKAVKLISTTDLPIGMIADECGFSSTSNFSKAFSRITGMSPRDYRSKCLN